MASRKRLALLNVGILLLSILVGLGCAGSTQEQEKPSFPRLAPEPVHRPPTPTASVTVLPERKNIELFLARFLLEVEQGSPLVLDSLASEASFRSTESNQQRSVRAALETAFLAAASHGHAPARFALDTLTETLPRASASDTEAPAGALTVSYVVEYVAAGSPEDEKRLLFLIVAFEDRDLRIARLETKSGAF